MRGSFPSAKLADMKDAMENHASVSEKCLVFSIVHPFFQLVSTCICGGFASLLPGSALGLS